MIPEQRQRAGVAVQQRMQELGLTLGGLANQAHVSERTVRALVHGDRWPGLASRERIAAALGWPSGMIARTAVDTLTDTLATMDMSELLDVTHRILDEVAKRANVSPR